MAAGYVAGAQGYMDGGADDGDEDRFLYVYDVPPPQMEWRSRWRR